MTKETKTSTDDMKNYIYSVTHKPETELKRRNEKNNLIQKNNL